MIVQNGIQKNKGLAASTTNPLIINIQKKYTTKKENMLLLFVQLGEKGINCFEAANQHNDYVLRSTVSGLQRNEGFKFSRKGENVPNSFGKRTHCVRYWLDDENIAKALEILGTKAVS